MPTPRPVGRRSNLPAPVEPLIGRDAEAISLHDLLTNQDVRLVTLTGPGGIGKTRLAQHVAAELRDHFPHGVFFVPLASLADPDLVIPTIVQDLGLADAGARPLPARLHEYVRDRALLLVLDNFEHVLPAALAVADLLAAAAGPSSGMTYTNRVFGPGWAGRTVRPTNTLPASWPRVRSSAWGSAGLAVATAAVGLAAVFDTGEAAGTAAAHATPMSIIARARTPDNRYQWRMAGTGYTVCRHPDWQSGLSLAGVPQPMRNNGHDPASAARADATLTDEQLMLELARGRHEALGSLYSRHSRLVFYLALQSLERPAAEELMQEVFLTIWRGASAFDPEQGSFRPWLLRLAHWRILNELRRRRRRPQKQEGLDDEGELFQQVLDQAPGPEERAFQMEHRRIVDSALETLPPKQREAVALAFLEDMTHEQVAEALDVPLGTAKTRIRSGLHSLRMVLAPVAASLFGLGFAVVGVRYMQTLTTLDRDQRALTLVTMSELAPLRLGATTSDLPAGAHATYRGRAGSNLAVLTAEGLPAPSDGMTYQAWVRLGDQWTSLGTFMPDADGTARVIAENAVLASSPNSVEITVESAGDSQTPSDTVVLRWLCVGG